MNLNSKQIKSLSEFFNSLAVAWFTAGIITPFFLNSESSSIILLFVSSGITGSAFFLFISLLLLKKKDK